MCFTATWEGCVCFKPPVRSSTSSAPNKGESAGSTVRLGLLTQAQPSVWVYRRQTSTMHFAVITFHCSLSLSLCARIALTKQNFTLKYDTNIPRQVVSV